MLLALALVSVAQPDVAYTARYYFEGRRKSYDHLYLCRHDGTHRQQVTFGAKSSVATLWIDHNHLAYIEVDGQAPREFSVGEQHWRSRLIVFNLSTRKKRVLREISVTDPWVYADDEEKTIFWGEKSWLVTPNRIVPRGKANPENTYLDGKLVIQTPKKNRTYKLEWRTSNEEDIVDQPVTNATVPVTVTHEEGKHVFKLPGGEVEAARAVDLNRIFVTTCPRFAKFQNDHEVTLIDWRTKTSKHLVTDIGTVRFDPDGIWAGLQQESRPLKQMKDGRMLWVNWLYAGDWHSGRRWTIAKGLVDVMSWSIRPQH